MINVTTNTQNKIKEGIFKIRFCYDTATNAIYRFIHAVYFLLR
jgi:hypothetical protein